MFIRKIMAKRKRITVIALLALMCLSIMPMFKKSIYASGITYAYAACPSFEEASKYALAQDNKCKAGSYEKETGVDITINDVNLPEIKNNEGKIATKWNVHNMGFIGTNGEVGNQVYSNLGPEGKITMGGHYYFIASEWADPPITYVAPPTNLDVTATYDGSEKTNGYTTPTGVTMTGDNKGTNAGTYSATYTLNTGYEWTGGSKDPITVKLTINKADSTITAAPTAKTELVYNTNSQELINPGTANGGTMKYQIGTTGSWQDSVSATDAGTYDVYYYVEGDTNHNNSAVQGPVKVTIEKAEINPTISPITGITYGDTVSPVLNGNTGNGTVTYTYTGTANDGTEYNSSQAPINAGDYHVYAEIGETANYKGGKTPTIDFTIAKADPELTDTAVTGLMYTGLAQELIVPGTLKGINDETGDQVGTVYYGVTEQDSEPTEWIESESPTGTNARTYKVWHKVTGGPNYKDIEAKLSQTVSIAPAPLNMSANDRQIIYGQAPVPETEEAKNTSTVTFDGFVNGETKEVLNGTIIYDYHYAQFDDVGTYVITPEYTVEENLDNYVITASEGTLTVVPKPLTLKWGNTSLWYNGQEQAPSAYISGGVVNNDDVSVVVMGQTVYHGNHTAVAKLVGAKAHNYVLTNYMIRFDIHSYYVTEGGNQILDQRNIGDMRVVSNGPYSKFVDLYIDDVVVPKEHYSSKEGSTVVFIKESYLKTLAAGKHSLMFAFTDGYAWTDFIIGNGYKIPKTGID